MQFAADYPTRTRTLAAVSGPASVISISNSSNIPERDRLGSVAAKEMIEYWNNMFATAPEEGTKGLAKSSRNLILRGTAFCSASLRPQW